MTAPDARTPAGVDDPRADHVSTAAGNVVASRLPAAAEWSVAALLTVASIALAGLSDNDFALRTLGMTLGLLVLAALWWAALRLTGRPPLLALLLFGLSPVGVRYGDSLRAYPFATLTIIIAFVLVSRAH